MPIASLNLAFITESLLAAAKEWEEKYQKQFKDAVWHASFQGQAKQIPLPRVQQSSKHVRNPEQPKEATKTTLYSYRLDHLLDVLYPNSARQQSGSLKRKRLWRQVLPAFKQGINLTLTVTDLATGRETELHVGSVHFARTHSIAAGGLATDIAA